MCGPTQNTSPSNAVSRPILSLVINVPMKNVCVIVASVMLQKDINSHLLISGNIKFVLQVDLVARTFLVMTLIIYYCL